MYQKQISKQNAKPCFVGLHVVIKRPQNCVFPAWFAFHGIVCCPPHLFCPEILSGIKGNTYWKTVMFESRGHCSRTEETEQQRENHETQGKGWRKHNRTTQKKTEMEIRKCKSLRQNRNSNQINQESAQALCTSCDMASGKFTSCTGIVNRCPMATDSLTHRLGKLMAGQTWYTVWFQWCVVCMCVCAYVLYTMYLYMIDRYCTMMSKITRFSCSTATSKGAVWGWSLHRRIRPVCNHGMCISSRSIFIKNIFPSTSPYIPSNSWSCTLCWAYPINPFHIISSYLIQSELIRQIDMKSVEKNLPYLMTSLPIMNHGSQLGPDCPTRP